MRSPKQVANLADVLGLDDRKLVEALRDLERLIGRYQTADDQNEGYGLTNRELVDRLSAEVERRMSG